MKYFQFLLALAILLTACQAAIQPPTPTATLPPTSTSSPVPTSTNTPEPTPTLEPLVALAAMSQDERVNMVPGIEAAKAAGMDFYASLNRPDLVFVFDPITILDSPNNIFPVKAYNLLEEKWYPINDIAGAEGSRGKDWSEVGTQVYKRLDRSFLEVEYIEPVPVENGVKDDKAIRYYPTFTKLEDILQFIVNVEGARHTKQDIIDYATNKNTVADFVAHARETLYRPPSGSHVAAGDFTTLDGTTKFNSTAFRHLSNNEVLVFLYEDRNRFAHYAELVLQDGMGTAQVRALLQTALDNPNDPNSIIPAVTYDIPE